MYEEYTNYPTWALAQWIHSEQESTEFFGNIASKIYESYTLDREEGVKALADSIRTIVEDDMPDIEDEYYGNMYSNTLRHAIEAIDYIQIARELLQD